MIKIILEYIRKRPYNKAEKAREQRIDRVIAMADMHCGLIEEIVEREYER